MGGKKLQILFFIIKGYFLIYFIDYAITVAPIFPSFPTSTQFPLSLQQYPHLVHVHVMHISHLASPCPVLCLTSPCLYCTYQFVLLNPCNFSNLILPLSPPTW